MGPEQVLPLWMRMDWGVIASLTIRWFSDISRILVGVGGLSPFAEMQLVYSTAPADWANCFGLEILNFRQRIKQNLVRNPLKISTF